jgi:hypothetical protein
MHLQKVVHRRPVPDWLTTCNTDAPVPTSDLLKNSVYYPACGFDGRPVKYCGSFSHSFIYVDYGVSSERIVAELWRHYSFGSYRIVGGRFVAKEELLGPHNWQTQLPIEAIDGNPRRYKNHVVEPFAYWAVFERATHLGDSHGPQRFSLLYIAGDGAATFQSLYYSNRLAPCLVAVIQPGEGFGYNWTNFYDSRQIFARSVLANPHGLPDYLLLGGNGADLDSQRSIVWPGFSRLLKHWRPPDEPMTYAGYLGLWTRIAPGDE